MRILTKYMEVLYPPQLVYKDVNDISIFLAGTIDNGDSPNWQEGLIEHWREQLNKGRAVIPAAKLLVLNPRIKDWDSKVACNYNDPVFYRQVNWEMRNIMTADCVLFNILPTSKSPVTLLELGMMAPINAARMSVVCPSEFYRYGNVQAVCDIFHIPLYNDIPPIETIIKNRQ